MTPEKNACRSRKPTGNLEEVLDFSLWRAWFFSNASLRSLSAYGTERTCRVALHMSAFGGHQRWI